jgi:SAM-dependent methyltransferase
MLDFASPKSEIYTDYEYLQKNPTWHVEDSKWKADHILRMLRTYDISPQTVCEVGCGAGETLKQLQANTKEDCEFFGYEISPTAFRLCEKRANQRLHFKLKDIASEDVWFDLLLVIDVIEHIEDYWGFLRSIRTKSKYKIFHIPLEFCAGAALRTRPLDSWNSFGHIHYFMKDTALQSLKDTGYEIIGSLYTFSSRQKSLHHPSPLLSLQNLIRMATFVISRDYSVRLFGGYSLLVLAK